MRIPVVLGVVLLGVVVSSGPGVRAQAGPSRHPGGSMDLKTTQMMADMKAGDAKLEALVATMNNASADARLDAAVAVINELVRQKKAMAERMEHMHQQMMPMPGSQKPAQSAGPHQH